MIAGVWWPTVFPALAIATTVIAVNLIADALSLGGPPNDDDTRSAPPPSRPQRPRRPSWSTTCRWPISCAGSHARSCAGSRSNPAPGRVVRPGRRVRLRQVHHGLRRGPLPAAQRRITGGASSWRRGRHLMSDDQVRDVPMHHVSMVYQDPGGAINPTTRSGPRWSSAFTSSARARTKPAKAPLAAFRRGPDRRPDRVLDRYPYQLSGGMQQRVVIAMALAGRSAVARPGRADHRARRHRRGRGPRPRPRAAGRDPRRGAPHRAQPRRHPHDVRPRRRHVRGQVVEEGTCRRSSTTRTTRTR